MEKITGNQTLGALNPMRFKGYYLDSDTGMYYLQSRYYDPSLRRFINADAAELISDLANSSVLGGNVFAYCENNGVNDSDNNGMISISAIGGFIWKVFVEIIPIIGLIGLAKKFIGLIVSFQIPFWGKIKAIAKFIKCAFYFACIINDLLQWLKKGNTIVHYIAYTADIIIDTLSLICSIFNVRVKNIIKIFKKRKIYMIFCMR